jgi:hypothetical protein
VRYLREADQIESQQLDGLSRYAPSLAN